MTYYKIKTLVLESEAEGWRYNDKRGVYVYKGDVGVSIVNLHPDDTCRNEYSKPWVQRFDPKAYRLDFEIRYHGCFVDEFCMVLVDSGGAILPMPQGDTMDVSRDDYHLCQIVDHNNNMTEYFERAGLVLGPNERP